MYSSANGNGTISRGEVEGGPKTVSSPSSAPGVTGTELDSSPGSSGNPSESRMADSGFEETGAGNGVAANSPERRPRIYAREDLLKARENPYCLERPPFLDPAFFRVLPNAKVVWDIVAWHSSAARHNGAPMAYREPTTTVVPAPVLRPTMEQNGRPVEKPIESLMPKRRPIDQKDKLREEQDGIILSPQRKSFGSGCHATFGPPREQHGREVLGREPRREMPPSESESSSDESDSSDDTFEGLPVPRPKYPVTALHVIPPPDGISGWPFEGVICETPFNEKKLQRKREEKAKRYAEGFRDEPESPNRSRNSSESSDAGSLSPPPAIIGPPYFPPMPSLLAQETLYGEPILPPSWRMRGVPRHVFRSSFIPPIVPNTPKFRPLWEGFPRPPQFAAPGPPVMPYGPVPMYQAPDGSWVPPGHPMMPMHVPMAPPGAPPMGPVGYPGASVGHPSAPQGTQFQGYPGTPHGVHGPPGFAMAPPMRHGAPGGMYLDAYGNAVYVEQPPMMYHAPPSMHGPPVPPMRPQQATRAPTPSQPPASTSRPDKKSKTPEFSDGYNPCYPPKETSSEEGKRKAEAHWHYWEEFLSKYPPSPNGVRAVSLGFPPDELISRWHEWGTRRFAWTKANPGQPITPEREGSPECDPLVVRSDGTLGPPGSKPPRPPLAHLIARYEEEYSCLPRKKKKPKKPVVDEPPRGPPGLSSLNGGFWGVDPATGLTVSDSTDPLGHPSGLAHDPPSSSRDSTVASRDELTSRSSTGPGHPTVTSSQEESIGSSSCSHHSRGTSETPVDGMQSSRPDYVGPGCRRKVFDPSKKIRSSQSSVCRSEQSDTSCVSSTSPSGSRKEDGRENQQRLSNMHGLSNGKLEVEAGSRARKESEIQKSLYQDSMLRSLQGHVLFRRGKEPESSVVKRYFNLTKARFASSVDCGRSRPSSILSSCTRKVEIFHQEAIRMDSSECELSNQVGPPTRHSSDLGHSNSSAKGICQASQNEVGSSHVLNSGSHLSEPLKLLIPPEQAEGDGGEERSSDHGTDSGSTSEPSAALVDSGQNGDSQEPSSSEPDHGRIVNCHGEGGSGTSKDGCQPGAETRISVTMIEQDTQNQSHPAPGRIGGLNHGCLEETGNTIACEAPALEQGSSESSSDEELDPDPSDDPVSDTGGVGGTVEVRNADDNEDQSSKAATSLTDEQDGKGDGQNGKLMSSELERESSCHGSLSSSEDVVDTKHQAGDAVTSGLGGGEEVGRGLQDSSVVPTDEIRNGDGLKEDETDEKVEGRHPSPGPSDEPVASQESRLPDCQNDLNVEQSDVQEFPRFGAGGDDPYRGGPPTVQRGGWDHQVKRWQHSQTGRPLYSRNSQERGENWRSGRRNDSGRGRGKYSRNRSAHGRLTGKKGSNCMRQPRPNGAPGLLGSPPLLGPPPLVYQLPGVHYPMPPGNNPLPGIVGPSPGVSHPAGGMPQSVPVTPSTSPVKPSEGPGLLPTPFLLSNPIVSTGVPSSSGGGLDASNWDMRNGRVPEVHGRGRGMDRGPRRGMEQDWSRGQDRREHGERRPPNYNRDFERNMGPGLLDGQPQHYQNYGSQNHGYSGGHQHHRSYGRHHHHDEEEPEWFTSGPTSQNDMIELHGFEEEMERISRKKNSGTNDLGSRPPSSVDPVMERPDGVRHSSPLPQRGSAAGKPSGGQKAGGEKLEDPKQMLDFDELFKFPEENEPSMEVSAAGGSRFSRFFRNSEQEEVNKPQEVAKKPEQKDVGKLLTAEDLFNQPKPEARQPQSCEQGGQILNLLQRAQPSGQPASGDSHDPAKRAHIRQMTMQGKVRSLADIEGPEAPPQPKPGPSGDDMSAFQKLLAQVSVGAVKPVAPVDVGAPQPQQMTAAMARPQPSGFQNAALPGMRNEVHPSMQSVDTSMFDPLLNRVPRASPELIPGLPLGTQQVQQPPVGGRPTVAFPPAVIAQMRKCGVDVMMLMRNESQDIVRAVMDGRINGRQLHQYANIPAPGREAFANIAKALNGGVNLLDLAPVARPPDDVLSNGSGSSSSASSMMPPRGASPSAPNVPGPKDAQDAINQILQKAMSNRREQTAAATRDKLNREVRENINYLRSNPGAIEFAATTQIALRQAQAQAEVAQAHAQAMAARAAAAQAAAMNTYQQYPPQPQYNFPQQPMAQFAQPMPMQVPANYGPAPQRPPQPAPQASNLFMPTSVIRKMAERDREAATPTEQPIERPQAMPAAPRPGHSGPYMHPLPPSAMVGAATMQYPHAAASLRAQGQVQPGFFFGHEQHHQPSNFDNMNVAENLARMMGRPVPQQQRSLPRVPADQAMSVTDIERMLGAQRSDQPGPGQGQRSGPDVTRH